MTVRGLEKLNTHLKLKLSDEERKGVMEKKAKLAQQLRVLRKRQKKAGVTARKKEEKEALQKAKPKKRRKQLSRLSGKEKAKVVKRKDKAQTLARTKARNEKEVKNLVWPRRRR